MKKLFYGDNLHVLRDYIQDESVDLIYLDPPFNSKRDYNLLFKTPKKPAKTSSKTISAEEPQQEYGDAQITAFEDTWHWAQQAEDEFKEILKGDNTDVAELMQALRAFLKENDMMAYLTMMCNRLLELHRVLKPTGSLYLHCDPTASHYLKIVLDGVFGKENYRNEIIWLRTNAHNMKTLGWPRSNDTIFYYTKSSKYIFNTQYEPYGTEQLGRYKTDETGKLYKAENLTFSSANKTRQFSWRGTTPPSNRSWGASLEQLEKWWDQGRILTKHDGSPRMDGLKIYLDDMPGKVVGTSWVDISRVGNTSDERLGYPTQKPLALLERIISASSNEGDVVLDPFCGCGTAVHAAEKLKRQWMGIDITHLAVSLIEKRMKEAFPALREKDAFEIIGTPQDLDAARDLAERDKHQFQLWACTLVGAQPYKGGKKGADGGLDGLLWIEVGKGKTEKVIVQVKGGIHVNRANIATLKGDIDREKAALGLFVTLTAPTREMVKEAAAAGHYEAPHEFGDRKDFPKVQILTIEGLLNGNERPLFPDLSRGEQTFKKAKKESQSGKQKTLFD